MGQVQKDVMLNKLLLLAGLRKYPLFFKLLFVTWSFFSDFLWEFRKLLRLNIRILAGDRIIRFYPEGDIPKVLWKYDFERAERDFISAFVMPGMNIVNAGANVGLYTIITSLISEPNGIVHAFEPSSQSYSRLLKNIELNGCSNVLAHRKALHDKSGRFLLSVDPLNPLCDGHRFVQDVKNNEILSTDEIVDGLTLDEYMTNKTDVIHLMIIDVEGCEYAVLRGAFGTISKYRPAIVMECTKYHSEIEILLRNFGYHFWAWNTHDKRLIPVNFRERVSVGNIIAMQEGAF